MTTNHVWVKWRDTAGVLSDDKLRNLEDYADVSDLRQAFVTRLGLDVRQTPFHVVEVRETEDGEVLPADQELTNYFLPPRGSTAASNPGPGQSLGTALFLTLPQQVEAPPPAKRRREPQTWGDLQMETMSPTEVPLPQLIEETSPPNFVAPRDWLGEICEEVTVQLNRQDSETCRVAPIAVVRCSRGGKTRALYELANALSAKLRDDTGIIYVSFNGQTSLSAWEIGRPLEALCRRILYAAAGGEPNLRAFISFAPSTVFEKEDVISWLGSSNCILLIDELNLVEATMNHEFGIFLKDTFLSHKGRALVFSSHVVSVTKMLSLYMHSPRDRDVKVKKLPLARDLSQARTLLHFHALSPHVALYLGLIPSLYYVSMRHSLPHIRREHAIDKYVDAGVSLEKVQTLLRSMLTGEYTIVPEVFSELMDIDVIEEKLIARWIPYHMSQVIYKLSVQSPLSDDMRACLGAIHEQFENFRTQKIQSGDGWEALFIVTLLIRCLTKSFCELVPFLRGFDGGKISWNAPFFPQVDFGCESLEVFVSGIPVKHTKSISIYYPPHAKFEAYDVIVAFWGDDDMRQLYGYQLKEGGTVPAAFANEDVFLRSYLIRGKPAMKDSSIRRWIRPSDDTLDKFFGESARHWTPKSWEQLRNSSSSEASPRNGKSH